MITLISVLFWSLALVVTLGCSYLLLLTLLSRTDRWIVGFVPYLPRHLRFDIIVPAHNESMLIARTVANLHQLDWPRESFRVIVVADNCSDDTAKLARAAGAEVVERQNEHLRGKGYALEYGFRVSRLSGWAHAVVVVDADTDASPNLLVAYAARILAGADAVQAHYGVRDPNVSWRTRLMCIALAAFHRVRSRARERLQLSSGLRGNGWCVTHRLLERIPYRAFSLAEDVEYGIELGLAGYRIHYADEAFVNGEMVSDSGSAKTQRRRWEHGRLQLVRSQTGALLAASLQRPSAICLDLALDLIVPPLSYIAVGVAALALFAPILWLLHPTTTMPIWLALYCCASLALYVLRGWQLSETGPQGLRDLIRAPFFVVWKIAAMVGSREPLEWVRTRRRAA